MYFFEKAIGILVVSNPDSVRVLFDKIASLYFIWKMYLDFSIGNGQPREPALCQLYWHTFVPYWVEFVCEGGRPVEESSMSLLLRITSRDYCLAKKVASVDWVLVAYCSKICKNVRIYHLLTIRKNSFVHTVW